jgi:segregation and condensation protein B
MNEDNRPPETTASEGEVRPESTEPPAGPPGEESRRVVETLIFAADSPMTPARIAQFAELTPKQVAEAVDELNREYESTGRTFRIHRVAQGYQFYTMPEYAGPVRAMYRRQFVQRLSKPALEVLAIVSYKQPVTRPEIEKLRGVDCSGPLLTLLERRLIATAGRARRPGSPFLYRTTKEFLRYFGLESLEQLPPLEEFGSLLAGGPEEGTTDDADTHQAETLAIEYPPERSEPTDAEPPTETDAP